MPLYGQCPLTDTTKWGCSALCKWYEEKERRISGRARHRAATGGGGDGGRRPAGIEPLCDRHRILPLGALPLPGAAGADRPVCAHLLRQRQRMVQGGRQGAPGGGQRVFHPARRQAPCLRHRRRRPMDALLAALRRTARGVLCTGALLPQRIVPNIESRIGHRNNIFEEIFTTLEADHSIDALRLVSALLHYYLASMRYLQQYRQAESPQAKVAGEDGIAQAAIHYLKENVGRRLTTGEVAAYVGYSVSYFSALFKRTTGQSPIGYFNRLKIEVACQMLATTDIQVNQLCFKVGIDDPYYFSRLFSRQMGCSPVEYRRRQHASTPGG